MMNLFTAIRKIQYDLEEDVKNLIENMRGTTMENWTMEFIITILLTLLRFSGLIPLDLERTTQDNLQHQRGSTFRRQIPKD
jgi:hypothetical protein